MTSWTISLMDIVDLNPQYMCPHPSVVDQIIVRVWAISVGSRLLIGFRVWGLEAMKMDGVSP